MGVFLFMISLLCTAASAAFLTVYGATPILVGSVIVCAGSTVLHLVLLANES